MIGRVTAKLLSRLAAMGDVRMRLEYDSLLCQPDERWSFQVTLSTKKPGVQIPISRRFEVDDCASSNKAVAAVLDQIERAGYVVLA